MIDEYLVSKMQSEYKSHFPKIEKKERKEPTEETEPAYYTETAAS